MFGENCGFSAHKCRGVNHYDHECHRETYRDKIAKYITQPTLPKSTTSTMDPPSDFQVQ